VAGVAANKGLEHDMYLVHADRARVARPRATRAPRRLPLDLAGLVVAIIVAIVARGLTIGTQSAWLDEGSTMAVARHPLPELIFHVTHFDVHPPLYYMALHVWLNLVGVGVTQGRLLSLLCGVATVPALYALTQELFDRHTASGAALLLAVSPIASWYSNEIRMYAMAAFLSLAALAFLVRAIHDNRWLTWLGYAVSGAAALYTDYSAAYILVGGAAAALAVPRKSRSAATRGLIAHAVLGILFLPFLTTLAYQITHNTGQVSWIPTPTPQIVETSVLDLISQYAEPQAMVAGVGLALAALAALALYRDWRQAAWRWSYIFLGCIVASPLVIPLVMSATRPAFLTRTVMMALYGLLILFARGILALLGSRRPWGLLPLTALLVVNLLSLRAAYATPINEDWRAGAAYLREQAFPGDVLIFDPSFLQLPFDLYWSGAREQTVERGYPGDEGLLTQPSQTLSAPADLARATARARTVWLLTREPEPASGALPDDTAGNWLRGHRVDAGYRHFHGVTIRRFTSFPISVGPASADWLDAVGIVLHHSAPGDFVVAHGAGSRIFGEAWNAYAHGHAALVQLGATGGQNTLTAALPPQARTIWLVTIVSGFGDPAGVANNWLYHQGPQVGPVYSLGPIRVYSFTRGSP